jgi:hypothetical protein
MKKQLKRLTLLLVLFFSITTVNAQERQITGTVNDNAGSPVINASVIVKGTNAGTSTDATGHFSISVKGTNAVLEISSVGFKNK